MSIPACSPPSSAVLAASARPYCSSCALPRPPAAMLDQVDLEACPLLACARGRRKLVLRKAGMWQEVGVWPTRIGCLSYLHPHVHIRSSRCMHSLRSASGAHSSYNGARHALHHVEALARPAAGRRSTTSRDGLGRRISQWNIAAAAHRGLATLESLWRTGPPPVSQAGSARQPALP